MIIQNEPVSTDDKADLSFTVDAEDLRAASEALGGLDISESVQTDDRVGKVSVVGAGMRSHPGVAAKVFRTLGENGINIEMIATSPIKISCVIDANDIPSAVRALHEAFELGSDAVRREEPTGAEHRPRVTP
jgi:aspartate kinase